MQLLLPKSSRIIARLATYTILKSIIPVYKLIYSFWFFYKL